MSDLPRDPLQAIHPGAVTGLLGRLGLAALVFAGACAGPSREVRLPDSFAPAEADAPAAAPVVREAVVAAQAGIVDPAQLLPSTDSADDVVAQVGEVEIRKRHVYEYLAETEPKIPQDVIEILLLDALVARAAELWGIGLEEDFLLRKAEEQQSKLRAGVERELGARLTFARYLQRQFGMSVEEHARWLRTNLTRGYYREYVLRFAALRADRVEVRYIVHADRKVLEDVADKVRQGASFATLAIRHTEDDNRMDGGLLPPFGVGFDHPVADVGFRLSVGELSEIFMREAQGSKRYYLVYCLRRIPGRDVEFAAVRQELSREIENRPLDSNSMEYRAAALALEAAMESHDSATQAR